MIRSYIRNFGVKGVIHRWYNAYGPGQHTHPVRKAVPYFILQALHDRPLKIFGHGHQTADFIHVDDVAKVAVEAMSAETPTGREVVEVGSGFELSVNNLAKRIIKLTNSKSEIVHVPMRMGEEDNTRLCADISRLRGVMGFEFQFKDFDKGMMETIEHYRNLPEAQKKEALDFYEKIDQEKESQ
jgi:UDP-glucose 4-epimerase